MTPAATLAAAELLLQHHRAGSVLDALPEALRPSSRAEGYAIQAQLQNLRQQPLVGWKIAATSVAGQRHIGVDGPLAGRLLADRVFADGATLAWGGNRMRVAEAEFAFRLGRTLPAREQAYDMAEVLDAVAALHVAIEVPDSRYADYVHAGAAQLIADNACAHQFVLGPQAAPGWRQLDLSAHRVLGVVAGRYEREGIGANVLGDPRLALTWLANELRALGQPLAEGSVVTTGTCVAPLELAAGDEVHMDFGVLGRVSCRFDNGPGA